MRKFIPGKKNPIYNEKIPVLGKYMVKETPKVPSIDYLNDITIPYGMMLNNNIGCCTIAGVAHLIMAWSSLSKTDLQLQYMTDTEVLTYYEILGHYNPTDPSTDQGCMMTDVLNYWMNTGIRVGTILNKIDGYAMIDPKNTNLIRYALNTFGGLYIGIQLPEYCENNNIWKMDTNMGPILGGHCITLQGMDDDNNFYGISWGEKMTVEPAFLDTYCDEIYCVVDQSFVNPAGIDYLTLRADLQKLKN